MKYVFNGRFLSQRLTGVQRYASEILSRLDEICAGADYEIAVPYGVSDVPQYKNIKVVRLKGAKGVLWEQTAFVCYVKKHNAVSVNLCNSAPLTGRKVVTIHDIKIKVHPEFFSRAFRLWYNFLFKNLIKKSLAIITVSEFSKDEIVKYYGCPADKIHVINSAWQHYLSIPYSQDKLAEFGLKSHEYIFALGSLEPNKNLNWVFNVARNNPGEIFAVGGGINNAVFAQTFSSVPENVRLLGYLSDEEAKSLMRYSKAFVFPSFYEGFGLPPMEAMVAGAQNIIVSDIPVMHEIFGDTVFYIDAERFDYVIEDIIRSSSGAKTRDNLLASYGWDISAGKLYALLNGLGG